MMPDIRIHIEELVLNGFTRAEAARLSRLLEEALRSNLEAGRLTMPQSGSRVDRVDMGEVRLQRRGDLRALADRIADAALTGDRHV